MHYASDLIQLFNQTFEASHNTILVGGGEEPLYLPADQNHLRHRIIFRLDYFASGLHEIAHWCIAGRQRRQQVDYGYWYEPDGRDAQQQARFEAVEARPQAIEWAFSRACQKTFRISLDNLDGPIEQSRRFQAKVEATLRTLEEKGFPPRAQTFISVLSVYYQRHPGAWDR
ncbi:elongation factor P hydroxylase [Natronospira proteinivora]|uniref:Elongation factor P hydroxylase n=1 Tax=Natronospira proteinivora TaxID=1807133 RepID=A0ABT1G8W2_9GAMM|nr:elongation factor P hydroxylase [Natronospira proteinivora]MCP1727760.1 elongation factor P hydroxylase [Natronospira proteinivora]